MAKVVQNVRVLPTAHNVMPRTIGLMTVARLASVWMLITRMGKYVTCVLLDA